MYQNKKENSLKLNSPFTLTHKDSNLKKLNQNQLCYHYTMGQSVFPVLSDLGVQK